MTTSSEYNNAEIVDFPVSGQLLAGRPFLSPLYFWSMTEASVALGLKVDRNSRDL